MQHDFLFINRASDCKLPKSSDSSFPSTRTLKSVYSTGTGFIQCFEREQVKSLPSLCIAKMICIKLHRTTLQSSKETNGQLAP